MAEQAIAFSINGRDVEVLWRRPHVRPESFLQIPLRWLATASEAPGAFAWAILAGAGCGRGWLATDALQERQNGVNTR